MIKLLHTADWHIGQSLFGYDRNIEHEHFLQWLIQKVAELDIDVLIIAGDVFDTANPSAAAQRMLYRFLRKVTTAHPNLQIVIVAGNHDSAARLEAPSPLLEEMNTTIKGMVKKQDGVIDYKDLIVPLKNKTGKVEAFCLAVPFLRQGDYPALDTEGNPYSEGVRAFYEEIIRVASEEKEEKQSLVAVGHLQTIGAEIAEKDASERIIIGGLEAVQAGIFANDVQYTALGHIHKAQKAGGRDNIRYAGSPLPMSFAEKNYKHGVEYVELDEGKLLKIEKQEYTPLVSLLSVPASQSVTPDEVLELLKLLPEANESVPAPYLQVLVLLEEPAPMLRIQIEEVLAGKHARLARIVSVYKKQDGTVEEEEIPVTGLMELTPHDVVKSVFEKTYHTDIPADLLKLFDEAWQAVHIEAETDNP